MCNPLTLARRNKKNPDYKQSVSQPDSRSHAGGGDSSEEERLDRLDDDDEDDFEVEMDELPQDSPQTSPRVRFVL